MKKKWLAAIATLALGALVLTGCGKAKRKTTLTVGGFFNPLMLRF